jgi:hypothetical protein
MPFGLARRRAYYGAGGLRRGAPLAAERPRPFDNQSFNRDLIALFLTLALRLCPDAEPVGMGNLNGKGMYRSF